MENTDVPIKTAAGEEALQQRTGDLQRQLRTVLILVDGRSDVAALRSKAAGMDGLEQALDELQQRGLVRTDGQAEASGGPSNEPAEIKSRLIEAAQEILGKDADRVVEKLNSAPDTKEGILEVTRNCKKLVALIIDEKKAEALTSRCQQIIGEI